VERSRSFAECSRYSFSLVKKIQKSMMVYDCNMMALIVQTFFRLKVWSH